jgi:hypothetical protein
LNYFDLRGVWDMGIIVENGLRTLPSHAIDVIHEPMTPRYARAMQMRMWLARSGIIVGQKKISHQAKEVAVWLENPIGRKRAGLYACFRIYYSEKKGAVSATLFCFYDGTEQSPVILSLQSAQALASRFNYEKPEDHING